MDKTTLVERFASTPEQKIQYSHLLDLMQRTENRNVIATSGFLTEAEADGAEKLLRAAGASSYLFFGGYPEAERKCVIFLPDYFDADAVLAEPPLAELVYLVASVNKFDMGAADFSHRDVLGSLMGLGIERDVVGDIVTDGGTAVMVVKASIADFIAENLTKIGRYAVTVTAYERYHVTPKRDFEEGYDTVASLRLDAVVSSIFKTSRGMAADAIGGGLVTVNGIAVTKSDMTVREGDKIALRGKGKAVLDKTDGFSKKGRIRFAFRRYR
jgi:RNA-binding protein YlmH